MRSPSLTTESKPERSNYKIPNFFQQDVTMSGGTTSAYDDGTAAEAAAASAPVPVSTSPFSIVPIAGSISGSAFLGSAPVASPVSFQLGPCVAGSAFPVSNEAPADATAPIATAASAPATTSTEAAIHSLAVTAVANAAANALQKQQATAALALQQQQAQIDAAKALQQTAAEQQQQQQLAQQQQNQATADSGAAMHAQLQNAAAAFGASSVASAANEVS